MTTPLFMLRCLELGLSIADLELITIGMATDMYTEKSRDNDPVVYEAQQTDFNNF